MKKFGLYATPVVLYWSYSNGFLPPLMTTSQSEGLLPLHENDLKQGRFKKPQVWFEYDTKVSPLARFLVDSDLPKVAMV